MKDYLIKAYCYNGTARIYAAITTNIYNEAKKTHNLWPTSNALLGRVLTIGAIMTTTYKSNEHISIRIDSKGPAGTIIAEGFDGKIRGLIHNPGIYMVTFTGAPALEKALGNDGEINVTKDLHMRTPFTSTCELSNGNIADDFTYYFAKSEQIPSAVGLGEDIDSAGNINCAGGFLLQIMPGCKSEDIAKMEARLEQIPGVSEMLKNGYTAERMIKEITNDNYEVLEEKELSYYCDCSKERFTKGIKSLGIDEVEAILKENGKADVKCHFCNKEYHFSKEDLENIIIELDPNKKNAS